MSATTQSEPWRRGNLVSATTQSEPWLWASNQETSVCHDSKWAMTQRKLCVCHNSKWAMTLSIQIRKLCVCHNSRWAMTQRKLSVWHNWKWAMTQRKQCLPKLKVSHDAKETLCLRHGSSRKTLSHRGKLWVIEENFEEDSIKCLKIETIRVVFVVTRENIVVLLSIFNI